MALNLRKFSIAASLLAASSMAATPAGAVALPQTELQHTAAPELGGGALEYDRRWRGYRDYHRHRGPDAGDVIAGVLVLGAVAAIASSASKNRRDRDYRDDYPDRRNYDRRYDERRGIEGAVDMCVDAIEQGRDRVETVDDATRDGSGWTVRGELGSGEGYSCRIDNDGRLRNLSIREDFFARYDERNENEDDGRYVASRDPYAVGERGRQWSDDDYSRARAQQGGSDEDVRYQYREAAPTAGDAPQPAYPGGPLPGEEQQEASPSDTGDDGRYSMAI